MTIEGMKKYIITMYDTDKWRKRVETMEDRQVIAIYHKFKKEGKKPVKVIKPFIKGEQLSLFN